MSDDRAERRAERRAIADKLDQLLEKLEAAHEAGEISFLEMVDRSLEALKQTTQVLDLIAPEKVEVQFVDEFSNRMAPKGVKPNPELLEAMRKLVLRQRAEEKAAQKELDDL
jgi:hypothetical protein